MTDARSFSGFSSLPVRDRLARVAAASGLDLASLESDLAGGGLEPATADKIVENVIGTYALPLSVAVHLRVNGRDRVAPMAVEEPSVVAAAAAKLVGRCGGFEAGADEPVMIAQVQVTDVPDPEAARTAILAARAELLAAVDRAIPGMRGRGGGARDLEVRVLAADMIVAHLLVDCRDAMGANLLNTAAEAVGPRVAELARGRLGLRILSNLADRRLVRVRCRVQAALLARGGATGPEAAEGVERASRFAEIDPYRAATHNKGIMNGTDAVVVATGNDWRAVEAGAHAYAARSGAYRPLATWRRTGGGGSEAVLEGVLEMPLALGTVGGTLGVHRAARAALRIAGASDAGDLAMLAACVGMATNLAALRALATEGLQRGHMGLHARSLAVAAGATGDEVERVAAVLRASGEVTRAAAAAALSALRAAGEGAAR
jgi:hydroxymethylglutaryl-CoA reductase